MNYSEYEIIRFPDGYVQACYSVNQTGGNYFQARSALRTSLPLSVLQLCVFLFTSRLFVLILKPLRQPLIVSNLLAGVVLGPSVLGKTSMFVTDILPLKSFQVLGTLANLALVYHTFLVGLEMDVTPIMNTGWQPFLIAISGILLPFCLGVGWFNMLHFLDSNSEETSNLKGSIFWALSLTASNFPEVTQVLTDLKLLRTDLGRLAMSSSVINDFFTWILLVIAMSMLDPHRLYIFPSTLVFILVCVFVVRPILSSIVNCAIKGDDFIGQQVWFVLGWIAFFGFITDALGLHSMLGSFMLGVIMPRQRIIKIKLVETLDDFVSAILMPFFFLGSGTQTDVQMMLRKTPLYLVILVLIFSFLVKILSTWLVCVLFYKNSLENGFALGVIMNTKGVLGMLILHAGLSKMFLDTQTFTLMVLSLVAMTCLVEPLITASYAPRKNLLQHKHRTIESVIASAAEFKILACLHSNRDIPTMITLLEVSNASRSSPIAVCAVHFVELTGRATAMLIVHDQCKGDKDNLPVGQLKSESDQIIDAFQSYQTRNDDVSVETITAVSPYKVMHDDICSLALDKRASLIIMPFLLTANDRIEDSKPIFPDINKWVLERAPCSVGLLVDRGLNSIEQKNHVRSDDNLKALSIAMLFIGGPDDREALAYAWRMAGHPFVNLTVLRFLPGNEATMSTSCDSSIDHDREKRLDYEYMYEFMFKTMDDESISYTEKVVNNGEETLAAIRENCSEFDLYIVGRGEKTRTVLTFGLSDWNSCMELGTMGDTIASSNFALHASILVVQQYASKNYRSGDEGLRADHDGSVAGSEALMVGRNLISLNYTAISLSHHVHQDQKEEEYEKDEDEEDDDHDD